VLTGLKQYFNLRHVNNVTIVNKFELLSADECICILMQPLHCM